MKDEEGEANTTRLVKFNTGVPPKSPFQGGLGGIALIRAVLKVKPVKSYLEAEV